MYEVKLALSQQGESEVKLALSQQGERKMYGLKIFPRSSWTREHRDTFCTDKDRREHGDIFCTDKDRRDHGNTFCTDKDQPTKKSWKKDTLFKWSLLPKSMALDRQHIAGNSFDIKSPRPSTRHCREKGSSKRIGFYKIILPAFRFCEREMLPPTLATLSGNSNRNVKWFGSCMSWAAKKGIVVEERVRSFNETMVSIYWMVKNGAPCKFNVYFTHDIDQYVDSFPAAHRIVAHLKQPCKGRFGTACLFQEIARLHPSVVSYDQPIGWWVVYVQYMLNHGILTYTRGYVHAQTVEQSVFDKIWSMHLLKSKIVHPDLERGCCPLVHYYKAGSDHCPEWSACIWTDLLSTEPYKKMPRTFSQRSNWIYSQTQFFKNKHACLELASLSLKDKMCGVPDGKSPDFAYRNIVDQIPAKRDLVGWLERNYKRKGISVVLMLDQLVMFLKMQPVVFVRESPGWICELSIPKDISPNQGTIRAFGLKIANVADDLLRQLYDLFVMY